MHRVETLEEFYKKKIRLGTAELNEIKNASSKIKVQGERYPEQLQKL